MISLDKNELPKDSSFRRNAILDSLKTLEREKDFILCACVMWNEQDVWLIQSTEMTEYPLEMWDPFWTEIIRIPQRLIGNRLKTISRFRPSPFLYSFEDSHNFLWEPVHAHDGTQLASLMVVTRNEDSFTEIQLTEVAIAARQIGRNLELELIQLKISKMNEALAEASRRASAAEFGEMVVHEINNPLSVIRSRLKMAMEKFDFDPSSREVRRYLEISFDMTNRLGKIVDGVRALAHDEPQTEYANCLIHDLIENIRIICEKRLVENGSSLFFQIDKNLSCECNATQITQVLVNLIHNASDAMRDQEGERKIHDFGYTSGENIWIDVTDSGPGVHETYRDQIFDPFFTTKKSSGGTGVGLSLTRKMVLAHGGALTLVNDHSPTTFRVSLPQRRHFAIASGSSKTAR